VLRAFKNSTRFFKNAQIYPDDVEVSTPDTGIFMKAEKASFKFVLYNVLSIGLQGNDLPVNKLAPGKRSCRVSIQTVEDDRNIVISFKHNYYRFDDSQLAETALEGDDKGAAVFEWKEERSNSLAVARAILARSGGRISVRNTDDGSEIRIIVPALTQGPETAGRPASDVTDAVSEKGFDSKPEKIKEGAPHVIVAEDEIHQLEQYKIWLEMEGYNVWLAGNAQEAFDLINTAREEGVEFQLAIFDVRMPVPNGSDIRDGIELTSKVREMGCNFPIFIASGHGIGNEHLTRMKREGLISDILSKPLNMRQMVTRVRDAIKKGLPRQGKSLEIQMASAGKAALIYGANFEKAVRKLKTIGFKGVIVVAANEEELKQHLTSGEHFDVIINTTNENLEDLIKRLLTDLKDCPKIIEDIDDTHRLQDEFIAIFA
ncbi:MAG: response regulator, partial [Candidatus Omnitrophota bacterium]